jgi:hypothetical protein
MAERRASGEWVEIGAVLLEPGERAPQVPEDTARVPLEMRCKGFLTADAEIGQTATIRTVTGRYLEGELLAANPGYDHGFGPPVEALLTIGTELRALLDDGEAGS